MKQIKVGLCAFGMSGKVFHAPFIKEHSGFSLTAIVERNREESKEKYPDAVIYQSVTEMLQNADVDLVVVNTPVQMHFDYVKASLEAGKNVIVEKPFTVSTAEAEELVRLAAEKNLFLSVYQNRRFDRDYLKVQKVIQSRKLGQIKETEIRFDRYRTEPSAKAHKENPELAGSGALHDLGSHLIDQATQLFGFPEKLFADVFSMKGEAFANDYFEILLYYKTGLRVRLKSSVFTREAHYAYAVHGSNGSFLQERTDNQESELVAGSAPVYGADWVKPLRDNDGILHFLNENSAEERSFTHSEPGNYMNYYQAIYDHLTDGSPLPSPGSEIIGNMKVIEATIESAKKGAVVSLNPF
ncbi:putative oxidoreductase [Flavobacteriaceae bacterium 3519-10]|nr:putative oxidoreductase [Flavobacteriaceae bacterium 3519-10]